MTKYKPQQRTIKPTQKKREPGKAGKLYLLLFPLKRFKPFGKKKSRGQRAGYPALISPLQGLKSPALPIWQSLKSLKGFSLVELLVTTGLASVILTGTFKMLDISSQSSRVVKSVSSEQDLRYTVKDTILLNEENCKHNLKPSSGGISQSTGVGELTTLKTKNPNKTLVQTGPANLFKGDLEVVKMELSKDGSDPTTTSVKEVTPTKDPVDRTFTVHYKKAGLGNFSTMGGKDCTATDTDGCYFVSCDLKYQLNSAGTEVSTCTVTNCGGSGGSLAGGANCYTVDQDDPKGRTLIGCGGASDVITNRATVLGYGAGAGGQKGVAIGYKAGAGITNRPAPGVYIGVGAGEQANTTGNESSVMIGNDAGQKATSNQIVAIGRKSCQKAGVGNICIGYKAGQHVEGSQSVIIGQRAGFKNSASPAGTMTGGQNVFIGSQAASHNTKGSENVFIGYQAGQSNTIGGKNVFIGKLAGSKNIGRNYDNSDSRNIIKSGGHFNTFVGHAAGRDNTQGEANTFVGMQAGKNTTTGNINTFVGHNAGEFNTTGYGNIFVGEAAGIRNSTGSNNTVIGTYSGQWFTSAHDQIFIGANAGEFITTGNSNTIIGKSAGQNRTSSKKNVLIGRLAGHCEIPSSETDTHTKRNTYRTNHCTGDENVLIGYRAGLKTSKGSNNVMIGKEAGQANTLGDRNIFIGIGAGYRNIGRHDNANTNTNEWGGHDGIFIGPWAGYHHTYGRENIFIGSGAGHYTTESHRNTFIGKGAGRGNTIGDSNTMVGALSGDNTKTGHVNAFYGYLTGWKNKGGHRNTFIGSQAGSRNEDSHDNTFVGFNSGGSTGDGRASSVKVTYKLSEGKWLDAQGREVREAKKDGETPTDGQEKEVTLWAINSGTQNTFMGSQTGMNNTTGQYNTFVGYQAGLHNTTGNSNIFIGWNAGSDGNRTRKDGTGRANVFVGRETGIKNTTGSFNTFVGNSAGRANTTASENVFVGRQAGKDNTTGTGNVFVGYQAGQANIGGSNDAGSKNTFVGYKAGLQNTTGKGNTFVGWEAGRSVTTGSENTYVGWRVNGCPSTTSNTGSKNVFLGYKAGLTCSSGEKNIFIGHEVGPHPTQTESAFGLSISASNQLNIGNVIAGKTHNTGPKGPNLSHLGSEGGIIVNGNIAYTGKLKKCDSNGCSDFTNVDHNHAQMPSSSREYKKNIQPFTNYEKNLNDIVQTPLFTYEYKKDQPEKTRWGVISEELPEHLQIQEGEKPSLPDWPSVFGTFWGAIKALNAKLKSLKEGVKSLALQVKNFKNKVLKEIAELKDLFFGLKDRVKKLEQQLLEESKARKALEFQLKELQKSKKPKKEAS